MSQLPVDCLNVIFEYLEKDKATLHSCLLVNRLWCEVSVRILWRDVQNYSTLIACLPNESKEIFNKNGIIISTPTSNPPVFNYTAFCKFLSINTVDYRIEQLLLNQSISSQNLDKDVYIVAQEMYKLFMSQISSLKMLNYRFATQNIPFTSFPGAKDCLKDLSVLRCCSNLYPEFFYWLSKICRNIQSLEITFEGVISNGLTDLTSVQQNLKHLTIIQECNCENLEDIIPSLIKLPNTLIKLKLVLYGYYIPFSFINKFTNLQELELSIDIFDDIFEDNEKSLYFTFPHVTFSQLQILRIHNAFPKYELLAKFLERNGKNLKEFYVGDTVRNSDNSLNLAIAKFCPNLRKLSTGFKSDELETLEMIFNNCQYLESIRILCGHIFLSEKGALEAFLKYSHGNVRELILYHNYSVQVELLPEELESFFVSWRNHKPKSSFSLIIIKYDTNSLDTNDENMKIIEKYLKLGVVKKFEVQGFDDC